MSVARIAVLLTLAALVGCGDAYDGRSGITAPVVSLQVLPNPLQIRVGETAALQVEGLAFDQVPAWTSENPAIATVSAGGFVRGLARGTTSVTASVGSMQGVTTIRVGDRPPVVFDRVERRQPRL